MSDDCISRQAVLDEMMLIPIAPLMVGDRVVYKKGVLEGTIKALPSVTPKPKTGKWIEYIKVIIPEPINSWRQAWKCSECGYGSQDDDKDGWFEWKYCPNCGAKMEVSNGCI